MAEITASHGDASHPAPQRDRVGLVLLLFGVAIAPIAWSLQLQLGYGFASHGCYPVDAPLSAPLWQSLRPSLIALSVLAILLGISGIAVSIRSWKRTRREKPGSGQELLSAGEGRTRFLAMSGMLVSGLFIIAVVLETIVLLLSPVCQ